MDSRKQKKQTEIQYIKVAIRHKTRNSAVLFEMAMLVVADIGKNIDR